MLSCGGKTIAAAASWVSRTRRLGLGAADLPHVGVLAEELDERGGDRAAVLVDDRDQSFGCSSLWKSPSAMTVITRIGIRSEKTSAERSRRKMRRSLRKTASMRQGVVSAARDLGAQALEQPLEASPCATAASNWERKLWARLTPSTTMSVARQPSGVAVQRVVDGEAVARGDDLGRDAGVVAGHRLLAVGEVGRVEEQQALHVGADEELVEERRNSFTSAVAASLEVLGRCEAGERVGVEEAAQQLAQLAELLLAVAGAPHDDVALLEHATA